MMMMYLIIVLSIVRESPGDELTCQESPLQLSLHICFIIMNQVLVRFVDVLIRSILESLLQYFPFIIIIVENRSSTVYTYFCFSSSLSTSVSYLDLTEAAIAAAFIL